MRRDRRTLRLATVGLVGATLVTCQQERRQPDSTGPLAAEVDRCLAPLLADHDLSGVILIGDRGSTLYQGTFGNADDEAPTPNTPEHRFAIASLTKTLTAGATLIAEARGLLGLDDSLERFGLDFPRAGDITVRHLLLHSSGLAAPDYAAAFEGKITLEQLVDSIVVQPLQFEPGSQHRYSNAGYNTLAWVIERASGTTYDAFLDEHVFTPLGMVATGHVARDAPDAARGHIPAGPTRWRERAPWSDPGYSFGSGSLYSTAEDLLRWGRAVGAERLYTWREREWPYGWGRVESEGHKGIEQTGATTGFMSNLLVFPDAGVFVVVLLNQEFGGWVPLGRDIAAVAFGGSCTPRDPLRPIELSEADRTRVAGRYVADGRAIEIVPRGRHVWLYSDGWPVGKYLTPLSPTEFAVRSDVGRVHFEDESDGAFRTLRWDFGESDSTYFRE